MLNFQLSNDKLWIQLQTLKKKLANFSNLSLIDSQKNKQLFLADFYHFLQQLDFDSIGGGYYLKNSDTLRLSAQKHALLAEMMLSVGLVFSEGELIYRGERLIRVINEYLFNKKNSFFIDNIDFSQEEAPFILNGSTIQNNLTTEEFKLLLALTDNEKLEPNKNYRLQYKKTLITAAEKIEMHYKQAQILEHTLKEKLIRQFAPYLKPQNNKKKTLDIHSNSYMANLLIELVIWHRKTDYIEQSDNLLSNLVKCLSDTKTNHDQKIMICYTLLNYSQINFKQSNIKLANEILISLKSEIFNFQSSKFLYHYSYQILKKLINLDVQLPSNAFNDLQLPEISVNQLPQSKIKAEIERQTLLSYYNPWLKVYPYHE